MSRGTQLLSLFGGSVVVLLGGWRLYQEGEWMLLILGLLIVAFTLSSIARTSQQEKDGGDSR
jgi:hypothetical protein